MMTPDFDDMMPMHTFRPENAQLVSDLLRKALCASKSRYFQVSRVYVMVWDMGDKNRPVFSRLESCAVVSIPPCFGPGFAVQPRTLQCYSVKNAPTIPKAIHDDR